MQGFLATTTTICSSREHIRLNLCICSCCRDKWGYMTACFICSKIQFWRDCLTCCHKIVLLSQVMTFDDTELATIQINCKIQYETIKTEAVIAKQKKTMPIIVLFFSLVAKKRGVENWGIIFTPHILQMILNFLTSRDAELCRKVCFEPIFHGKQVHAFADLLFQEPYFTSVVEYFHDEHQQYDQQLRQLLSLDKQYLFKIVKVKNFHRLFPRLIKLPNTEQNEMKNCLPLEFFSTMCQRYRQNLIKAQKSNLIIRSRKREMENLFYTYLQLTQRVELLEKVQTFKREQNPTRTEIQRFVADMKELQVEKWQEITSFLSKIKI